MILKKYLIKSGGEKKIIFVIYFLITLIVINFMISILTDSNVVFDQVVFLLPDYFSSILLFIYLYLIGESIAKNLLKTSVSFSIFFYLSSFFVFEILFSILSASFFVRYNFVFTNLVWLLLLLFKKNNYIKILKIIISYLILNIYNYIFLSYLSKNKNIIGDVKDVFFEQTSTIFEKGYNFSISNPVMEGYPQYVSYIQSLLFRISMFTDEYIFLSSTSYLIYFLTVLYIFENKTSKKVKIITVILFSALLFNSKFIIFLFTGSLMSEGIVSLFFGIAIKELLDYRSLSSKQLKIVFTGLGILFFSKQFISTIVLFLFFIFYLVPFTRKNSIFILFGFILHNLSFMTIFKDINSNYHLSQIDLKDTILDLIFVRDLNFNNVLTILYNVSKDKPFTVFLFLLSISFFYMFVIKGFTDFNLNFLFGIILVNLIGIFLLYISVWRNMELESPIRYIFNLFHIKLLSVQLNIESINQSSKQKFIKTKEA